MSRSETCRIFRTNRALKRDSFQLRMSHQGRVTLLPETVLMTPSHREATVPSTTQVVLRSIINFTCFMSHWFIVCVGISHQFFVLLFEVVSILTFSSKRSFHIVTISPLLDTCFANIFSQFVACIFSNDIFENRHFLFQCGPIYLIFFLYVWCFLYHI